MEPIIILVRLDSSMGGFIKIRYDHHVHLEANRSAVHFNSSANSAKPDTMIAIAAIAMIGAALSGNVELRRKALEDLSALKSVPLPNGVELKILN